MTLGRDNRKLPEMFFTNNKQVFVLLLIMKSTVLQKTLENLSLAFSPPLFTVSNYDFQQVVFLI